MNINDANHDMCHDYPGGVPALAARMKLADSTLYGMANPNNDAHPWSLSRWREALQKTGDKRPLHALCEENGGVFVPVGIAKESLPGALQGLADLSADFGAVATAAVEAMRDGRITKREADAFDTKIFELIKEAATLAMQMRAEADKAAAPVRAVK